jgi:hypothetical protein
MDVRFEDHARFQRCAAWCALGGAVLGASGIPLLPWDSPRAGVLAAALLGLLLVADRREAARKRGAAPPASWATALALAASVLAVALGAVTLPALFAALALHLPRPLAGAVPGSVLGLWLGLAALPLHLRLGGDALEAHLEAIRSALGPELRALAERAAAARREALARLPSGAARELPAALDALGAAALELAARAGELCRACSPQAEGELRERCAWLERNAQEASDAEARRSYQNAQAALSAQLDHLLRVRSEKERVLARLHENVAGLERARFSLTLLQGPDFAAELALLQERLNEGAAALEDGEAPGAPPRARA